jgi:hypothetical protein
LKFVEVVTTTVFVSGSSAPASSSFAINVWKLRQEYSMMTWEKEYVMDDTELWALVGCGDLPRVAPSLPFLSMEKPHVVYFVLTNRCSNEAWLIVVDMLNKTMQSLSRYNKVYPYSNGSDDDMASANLTTNRWAHPLLKRTSAVRAGFGVCGPTKIECFEPLRIPK